MCIIDKTENTNSPHQSVQVAVVPILVSMVMCYLISSWLLASF